MFVYMLNHVINNYNVPPRYIYTIVCKKEKWFKIFIAVFVKEKRYLYVRYHLKNKMDKFHGHIVGLLTRFITLLETKWKKIIQPWKSNILFSSVC